MPKCNNCGREFEGTFCPDCGTKYQQSKTCPECGAELSGSANFCNYCGHRFETQANTAATPVPVQPKQPLELSDNFYKTVSKLLKWLPCVFFLLFAALNFAFMSCNAYSAFGFNVGNIYKITDADYKVMATVLIIVSSISAAYALAYPLLIGKLPKVSHSVSFVLYIAMLVSASILNINIKKGDWTVDSATKLLIAFAVVFAVLSALALVGDMLLSKRSEKYLQAKTDLKNAPKPVLVQKISNGIKKGYAAHKKAVNGTIIGVCSVAVICVLVFAVIVPVATNIFTSTRLSKLNIGDDKTRVSKVLGTPNSGKEEDNVWTYYGKEFLDLYKQQEKLNKQMENLTDFEQLGKLMEQQAALDEKIRTTVGRQITVSFDKDGLLSSVVYDAAYSKASTSTAKEVKEITLGNKNTVAVEDVFNGAVNVRVKYQDGSYQLSSLPANVQTSDFGTVAKKFPSYATLKWRDSWGEYSQPVNFDESNYYLDWSCSNGELYIDGTIPTNYWMNLFNLQLPWIDYDVTSIVLGSNVTYMPALTDLVKDASSVTKMSVYSGNSNYYNIRLRVGYDEYSNIVADKNLNKVLFAPANVQIANDNADNTFVLSGDYSSSLPILILSSSKTDNLLLPYYNNGNYTVLSELENKYTGCEFDNGWSHIPERFLQDKNFRTITLPNSVTSIGSEAFIYCKSLTSITIPESVTSIGFNAFYNCYSLTGVYITDIAAWYNIGFGGEYANPLCYAHNLYLNGTLVTEFEIPDTVTAIKPVAFTGWDGTSITVSPNNTTYHSTGNCVIETATKTLIAGCSTSVIPTDGSVTSIGSYAFYGRGSLTSVTIPESIISIGHHAFANCLSLTEINYNATDCALLMPSDYDTDNDVFSFAGKNGDGITVNIGSNVQRIPANLFCPDFNAQCSPKIVSVVFSENSQCIAIGSHAFGGCTELKSIVIPDGVTSLGYDAFYRCVSLTNITIPDSISTIGGGLMSPAFSSCSSLQYNEYDNALYLGNTNNPYVALITVKDRSITTCSMHFDTKVIGGWAFSYCRNLTDIIIPESVTTIGDYAFDGCSKLTSVTIPDSVTIIGYYAFYDCSKISEIRYNGTVSEWEAITKGSNWNRYVPATKVICSDGEVTL